MRISEEQFENHLPGILAELGYVYENGRPSNLPSPLNPPEGDFNRQVERKDYREIVLSGRLGRTLVEFNPAIPQAWIEDAVGG